VALGFVVFAAAWRVEGGRWVHVETPSMGQVAPVGSLLWVRPVDFDSLAPGDFITFHPPGQPSATYSHRVYQRTPGGELVTKGVIPAPDPWRLHASDIVGKVQMNWWGAGWLVAAGPVLIIGFLLVGVVRRVVRQQWRLPAVLVLGSLVVALALGIHRPLLNAEQLAIGPSASGGAEATYVGTGLLPIRLYADGGGTVVLHDGEVGTVHVENLEPHGKVQVHLRPAVPPWWWAVLVVPCFLPALIGSRPRGARPATCPMGAPRHLAF
jgi:hypothetical protein